MTDVITRAQIVELVGHRNRALAALEDVRNAAQRAGSWAAKAAPFAEPYRQAGITICERGGRKALSDDQWRRYVDSAAWHSAAERIGLLALMSGEQRAKWREQLEKDPPEFTEESAAETFRDLVGRSGDLFRESIVSLFERLSRDFRSHNRFRFGERIIKTGAVSWWGLQANIYRSGYRGCPADWLDDAQRICATLSGRQDVPEIRSVIGVAMNEGASEAENAFLRAKWFRNGNLHLWFQDPEIVRRMNMALAAHYGEALADAD